MIVFGCNSGFVPIENMTAVCALDGRWIPDPATLVCTCKSTYSCLQGWEPGNKATMFVHSCAICKYMSKQKPMFVVFLEQV